LFQKEGFRMSKRLSVWSFALLALMALSLTPGLTVAQEIDVSGAIAEVEAAATEAVASADEAAVDAAMSSPKVVMDTLWVILAGALVFAMQLGFAYVEGGFTRAKNTSNIMMKNMLSICIGAIAYVAIGFAIMFGDGTPFFGMSGWFLSGSARAISSSVGFRMGGQTSIQAYAPEKSFWAVPERVCRARISGSDSVTTRCRPA
jgi:hypothetical protein